jgi:adenylate cyclase
MGENEALTLERLKAHQRELIDPTIEVFHGNIVKLMGDGMLVEFPSVVEAVSCAVTIQQGMAERNKDTSESRQIVLRIGINLGDIIAEGDDIFGDGVNIAARLEELATPGCICISGAVHDAIGNKLPLEYEYLGERTVKNIAQPVRTYSVQLVSGAELDIPEPEGPSNEKSQRRLFSMVIVVFVAVAGTLLWLQPWQQKAESTSNDSVVTTSLRERPSIAILPFDNMGGDPEQEYFVDGITEDIITDFSRLSNLTVIAWNTSASYKGEAVQPQQVGKDLGVAYVLDGSVRKSGDRLRISARLMDTENGNNVWAERYDRRLMEIFELQDEVTKKIVNALAVRLSAAEKEKLGHSSTNNIAAYDVFLRGQQYSNQKTKEGNELARDAYRQAIEHDPTYARAYGALAVILTNDFRNDWTELSVEEARARALELAQKAVALDPSSPQAYWALGFTYLFRKQLDEAAEAAKQAVVLSPNYADGYGLLAFIKNFQGHAEDAIRFIKKAMDLNPRYTYDYPWNLGRAYYTLGRYPEAVEALQEALERNENALYPRLFLAASYVRLGQQDDAKWEIEQIQILNPDTTLTHLANTFPVKDENEMNAFLEDLRKAGLPE